MLCSEQNVYSKGQQGQDTFRDNDDPRTMACQKTKTSASTVNAKGPAHCEETWKSTAALLQ